MGEKSRLYRTGKEINHSIKTQEQDFEVFPARDDTLPLWWTLPYPPGLLPWGGR